MTPQQLFPLDLLPPSYHRKQPLLDQVPSHSLGNLQIPPCLQAQVGGRQLLRLFLPFLWLGVCLGQRSPKETPALLSTWPCQKPL